MNKKIIKKQWLIILLLFFGVSGIFDSWSLYLLFFIFPILFYKTNVKKYIDSPFWWLVIFSVSFTIIWSTYSGFEPGKTIYYIFYPLLFYLLGGYFADKSYDYKTLLNIILIIIIAYSIIYIINAFYDTINYGLINTKRSINVYNESILGANFQQIRASLAIAGIGLLFVPTINSKEKTIKYIFISLSLLGLFASIHYVNRTGPVIAIISILVVSFKLVKKKSGILSILIIGILLIIIGYYLSDNTKIQLFIESYQIRELNYDSSLSTLGGRVIRWSWVINNIFTQPWGNISNYSYNYAHNLWLDAGRLTGIIPFVVLIIFTILNYKKVFKLLQIKKLPLFFCCLIIILNITFFLQSFIEPVLESDPTFFWLNVLLFGMQNMIYKNYMIMHQ